MVSLEGNGHSAGKDSSLSVAATPQQMTIEKRGPRETTIERMEFLWKLVATKACSPTLAVQTLSQRDGLSERQGWEIWKQAKGEWGTTKIVQRSIGLTICWHYANDELMRLLAQLQTAQRDKEWHRLLQQQLSILVDIAKAAGPDTLDINLNQNVNQRQELILRVGEALDRMNGDERLVATKFLAQLVGRNGSGSGNGSPSVAPVGVDPPSPSGAST